MATSCFSLIRGRVMRVTRLDGCGARVLGPDSTVVSDGFITVSLAPQTDEGTTISVTNAAGRVCILDTPTPVFLNYTIEIAFCGVDPDLLALVANMPLVENGDGDSVGFRVNSGTDLSSTGFALEVWSNVPVTACEEGASATYGYMLVPFVKGGILGDISIGNDAVNFTLTGAASKDGSAWGVGPYDVVTDEDDLPSPLLLAIDDQDHLHVQLTTVEPPTAACGAVALGSLTVLITAGIPATLGTNRYAPADYAELDGGSIAKTPTTAWTTGQHIVLRDGSYAYWDSDSWEVGVAP